MRRHGRRALLPFAALVVLTLAVLPLPTRAQEAPAPPALDVRVAVAPTAVTLGDRVRVTVTVRHDDDVLITGETPGRREGLVLIEELPPITLPGDEPGILVTELGYTLAAFRLGTITLGELRVSWLRDDGSTGSVTVTPQAFEVHPTITGDTAELHPLKPQAAVGGGTPGWIVPLAAAALASVLLAAVIAFLWRRLRRPAASVAEPAQPATPEAAGRRRLEQLAASAPLDGGEYDRFYGSLAGIVREYLEARFDFTATALTTTELEARMTSEGVQRWQARLVGGLRERCDAAVYARRYPDATSADHDLTVAFEIIELSRAATNGHELEPVI